MVDAARDPASGLPFAQLAGYWGDTIGKIANVLLITSVFAALLSFHNAVARYALALGRERVLPSFLGSRGRGSGAPIAGSVLQSLLAVVCVMAFVALGRDPLLELFTWLSYVAAVGVVLLMLVCSIAVMGYFRNGRDAFVNAWQRLVAPLLATVSLGAILAITRDQLRRDPRRGEGIDAHVHPARARPGRGGPRPALGAHHQDDPSRGLRRDRTGHGRGRTRSPSGPRFTQTDTDSRGLRV